MNLLIVQASPKKKGGAPVSSRDCSVVPAGRPEGNGIPQCPAGFSADSGAPSKHGGSVPFCTPLCGWPSLPCSGISGQGGSILPKPSLPVPAVCPMQQRLCGRETKSAALRMLQAWCEKTGDAMGRAELGSAAGSCSRCWGSLPHPDWHHSASDGVILFQHRNITRRAVVLPCHPDMHMAFFSTAAYYSACAASSAIRRERVLPNRFTRVMIPAFCLSLSQTYL